MSLSASSTFEVADAAIESGAATVIVQPAAAAGTGRGRLTHPTLGVYDYVCAPTETVNFDADVLAPPIWAHTMTLAGGVDALWPASLRDPKVIERWINGETGGPIEHLRALWAFLANPPDPSSGQAIVWAPDYATARTYRVALVGLRAGGGEITLDRRLLSYGYAPSPVELELRILGYAN